jgi:hypothetical protein
LSEVPSWRSLLPPHPANAPTDRRRSGSGSLAATTLAALLIATRAVAQSIAPAAPTQWQPDNRVVLGGSFESLTGIQGGGGGTLGYFSEPNQSTLLGVAADYQTLAGSSWAFGSLSAAYSGPITLSTRWSVHGDLHEGTGRTGSRDWDYSNVGVGGAVTLPLRLTVDFSDRQLDVETSHGNLPTVTLTEALTPHWLSSLAFAESVTGNLSTEYGLARVDFLAPSFGLLGGVSYGRVSPTVINIDGALTAIAYRLTEVFIGVRKRIRRVDLTLLADHVDLAGIQHLTVSVSATVHLK